MKYGHVSVGTTRRDGSIDVKGKRVSVERSLKMRGFRVLQVINCSLKTPFLSLCGNISKRLILNVTERFRCRCLTSGQVRCLMFVNGRFRCFSDYAESCGWIGC